MTWKTATSVLLPLLLVLVAPPAQATANGCSVPAAAPQVPTPFLVPPPFPNALLGPCTVVAVHPLAIQGRHFNSGAPACPPVPFVGPLPGELCGPLVPPGVTVTCTAAIPPNISIQQADLVGIVVGLDYIVPATANGNVDQVLVLDHEPLRHAISPVPVAAISTQVTNDLPLPARVIAYPSAVGPTGILVGCV